VAEIEADVEDILAESGAGQTRGSLRDDSTAATVEFFMNTCGLSKGEANRRTGLISNAFLGSEVAVRVAWDGPDRPPASEAIRSRLRRSRSRPGHSPK
jgi:hypothetical protein